MIFRETVGLRDDYLADWVNICLRREIDNTAGAKYFPYITYIHIHKRLVIGTFAGEARKITLPFDKGTGGSRCPASQLLDVDRCRAGCSVDPVDRRPRRVRNRSPIIASAPRSFHHHALIIGSYTRRNHIAVDSRKQCNWDRSNNECEDYSERLIVCVCEGFHVDRSIGKDCSRSFEDSREWIR